MYIYIDCLGADVKCYDLMIYQIKQTYFALVIILRIM